ncbi:hypothetical protein AAE478_004128 [Parahypoxylon ruwenzoriense]
MKVLRGLRRTLESRRPRYVSVSYNATPESRMRAYSSRSVHNETENRPAQPKQHAHHALSHPMRSVMRQLPHPVVVITTLSNTCEPHRDPSSLFNDSLPRPIPRAMTVSSFTSLSVDPVPRVTFNVTLPSTTHAALVRCGRFNAHILSGDAHGAQIAELFTRGNRHTVALGPSKDKGELGVLARLETLGVQVLGREQWLEEWEQARHYGHEMLSAFRSPAGEPPSGTLPVLQGKGVMHVLKCAYRELIPPEDSDFLHHAIVMGEVLDIVHGEAGDGSGIALSYADRAYRRPGEKLFERTTREQPRQTKTRD